MRVLKLNVAQAIQAYTGRPVELKDLLVYPDPKVNDCWAVRWLKGGEAGEDFDCVFMYGQIDEDHLEETEWETWPPVSGEPRFFV